MRNVDRPSLDSNKVFSCCVSGVRDKNLKARLLGSSSTVECASKQYFNNAKNGDLHLLNLQNKTPNRVTKKEMLSVYKRMTNRGSRSREIYDALKALPYLGICPFCVHGMVSTLDHVLPKAIYPLLAVTPDNLVGACKDCNSSKLNAAPNCAEESPLHPYFDDLSDEQWLDANVMHGEVAAVVFRVVDVPNWSVVRNARVRNQFAALKLGELYANQAAREISGQRTYLDRIFAASGKEGVRNELELKSSSWRKYHLNCWQSVAFRSLSESDWYCSGGFRN